MAGYGKDGVVRCCEILEEELVMVMKLMGTVNIAEIKREMV